jgi:hypothetical protein
MEEWRYLPPPAAKNSKQVRERNETDAKKSKVKHKSIKSFASKKVSGRNVCQNAIIGCLQWRKFAISVDGQ